MEECMRRIQFWVCAIIMSGTVFLPAAARAQDNSARLQAIIARSRELQSNLDKLPQSVRSTLVEPRRLSSLDTVASRLVSRQSTAPVGLTQTEAASQATLPADTNGLVIVNNRASDLAFSRFAGYSDTTSSTARCGEHVVVGYNRSASILETLINGTGGISFSGVAVSSNGGGSFRDLGAVPPGPNSTDFLFGEPSVTCSNPNNFYYAQMYSTIGANNNAPTSIALSTSNDGGNTWSDPFAAVSKSLSHTLDSPWSAVDPTSPKRIYVSYRDVDLSGTLCPNDLRTAIEVVVSNDGGQTFSQPIVPAQQCFSVNFEIVVTSRIAVSSRGKVFVAWEDAITLPLTLVDLAVTSFTPGHLPLAPVVVDQVVQGGAEVVHSLDVTDEFLMQGGFQNFRGIDLAVDRSGGPADGSVYVVWNDGRNLAVPDTINPFSGLYNFDDILFSRSSDGRTFSASAKLNTDNQPSIGRGFDHFQPAIAVDRTGKLAVCWKDTRDDKNGYQYERFCTESSDFGATWDEHRVTGTLSTPSRGQDRVINPDTIRNYDALTADFTKQARGFIGAFQWTSSGMNPDLKAQAFE